MKNTGGGGTRWSKLDSLKYSLFFTLAFRSVQIFYMIVKGS